ncbi:hypothetical protein MKX03_014243 [Papaver bracteatum]|nr:hypothetical protein MKX03_014243 [Papaver bracteatum]
MTVDGELFVEPADLKTRHFLRIKPKKYRFPVELKRLIKIDLQLTNPTDEYVAYKVRVTDADNYRPNPNRGIVLPGTTCNVLVNMLAMGESPDTGFEDGILIQSFIAPKGATGEDITPEMFWKESGKVVEEFELRVIYVPADPLGPEGSWEGSSAWASVVENGTYLLDAVSDSLLTLYYRLGFRECA